MHLIGSVQGHRYFKCPGKLGVFLTRKEITRKILPEVRLNGNKKNPKKCFVRILQKIFVFFQEDTNNWTVLVRVIDNYFQNQKKHHRYQWFYFI